ncbi:SCO3374 family protein [Streptomyces beijiangensis]|uniref:SCO3374 family protein n=1 Tax=Streptomyces beijiangensis TaxID=163361 RepID=UPI001F5D807F|nr:SCO3374 family protein [Streptomyces beijiangensis]
MVLAFPLPQPRSPLDDGDRSPDPQGCAQWYGTSLGWATAGSDPVQLLTGLRFDVLELPADAGFAVLRRIPVTGPVALAGRRMRLLVAAGSADELPGLLDWLEWGSVPLELTALGTGGLITAPVPPSWPGSQGAAVWLRPPEPGHEVEPTLPAFHGFGGIGGTGGNTGRGERESTPDLVRLVDTAATECHRARLLRCAGVAGRTDCADRTKSQPLACS